MSIKESNEITVKIKGSIENLYKILEERIYKIVDKFYMDDYYYIPANLEIEKMTTREILAKAVIVRNIKNEMYDRCNKKITFKIKEIDDKGNILKQEALNCEVINTDDAKKLLINFKIITTGDGKIIKEQSPRSGTIIEDQSKVRLLLE